VSPLPKTLAKLGELEAVVYRTAKHGERRASYEHEFGETGKRKPILALDPINKRLHVVGGEYTVTSRGIED
jgi:hypothetical protein